MRAFDDEREVDLGPGKQRAVLAVLLLNANKPVSTTQIIDAVWGEDPPENGANVVQKYVAGLRRALEPDRSPRAPGQTLALTDAGYVLSVAPGGLDADAFDDRVRRARTARGEGRPLAAAVELQAALAVWRAEALAGLSGSLFDSARERLAEGRVAAHEAWAEIGLELGRHTTLIPELVRLVAEYPLREQLRYLLILALYRCGRQAEALAAYRDARVYLAEEFGVEPGERLQQLHHRILRSDPKLAPPEDSPDLVLVPSASSAPSAPASPAAGPEYGVAPVSPPDAWSPPPAVAPANRRKDGSAPVPIMPAVTAYRWFRWRSWLWIGTAIVLSMGCLGYLTWAVVAVFAYQRRSWAHGVAALGYLAFSTASFVAILTDPTLNTGEPSSDTRAVLFTIGCLIPMVVGAVHAGVLCFTTVQRSALEGIERRIRRDQALQIAYWKPTIARELLIGRPDLPRQFDDGGLVDINAVPGYVIAALPGVTPYMAQSIVADRQFRGRFASVDDLVTRGLLPHKVADLLRDRLIVG